MFANPIDGRAWIAGVEVLMDARSDLRRDRLAGITRYKPLTWAEHVEAAYGLMERSARGA